MMMDIAISKIWYTVLKTSHEFYLVVYSHIAVATRAEYTYNVIKQNKVAVIINVKGQRFFWKDTGQP